MKNNKFILFLVSIIISNFIMLILTYFYTKLTHQVLFFDAFCIAIGASLPICFIWMKYNKNNFENFLVNVAIILFNIIFIYLGPITLDRSLSSFIYFYSAEKGTINSNSIYDDIYFKQFVMRRFNDGEIIGFLKCEKNICKPTLKTKLIYKILYPIGTLSHTLENYKEFKLYMQNKQPD